MTPPLDGRVRIARDGASALYGIACARPCGGSAGCLNTGGHPGAGPLPEALRGLCWLGSALTEQGARDLAARNGWAIEA